MNFDTPLSTVWPVFLTALLLLVVAWRIRNHLRPPRGWVVFVILAMLVRLVWIPGLFDHQYDGHEADYFDLFRGVRSPSRGGTMLYPGMQWGWWLLGRVLPGALGTAAIVPVLTVSLISVAAAGLLGGTVGVVSNKRAGWTAAALVALHPSHAAWSTSAYNVMIPHAFACLSLYATARLVSGRGGRADTVGLAWLSGLALAMGIALRMDVAMMGLACASLWIFVRPADDRARSGITVLGPALLAAGILAGFAVYPLLWPGEIPGSGERTLSWTVNWRLLVYHAPFDRWVGLGVLVVGAVAAARRWPRASAALIPLLVINHFFMAFFDDYSSRHTLTALVSIGWIVGAGSVALGRWGLLLLFVAGLLCGDGIVDLRQRYYGSEAAFTARLAEPPWNELERRNEVDPDCGWVAEDARVARNPIASHFNLLHPGEVAALRGTDGCLYWCLDVQDWRWSSRGVRDRAQRLVRMYATEPAFVVMEPRSGYACLVLDVGPRRTDWSLSNRSELHGIP